jgi:uncharacterized membrane protein
MTSRSSRSNRSCRSAAFALVLCGAAAGASAQTFRWLNDALPEPATVSELRAVSSDGSTVVGYYAASPSVTHAVKWDLSQASATVLPNPPGAFQEAVASAVSADGSVVVGEAKFNTSLFEATTWTGNADPVSLGGTIPGGFFGTSGLGCTDDGQTIVGSREQPGFVVEACGWAGGTLFPLGTQDPEGGFSIADDVTSDGFVIVGATDATTGTTMASRWSAFFGYAILPDIAGGVEFGEARAITPTGTVSVGYGSSTVGTEAVRWTHADWATQGWEAPDTLEVIGDLPGGATLASALAVSADGNTVVGYGSPTTTEIAATIWTPAAGLRDLKAAVLADVALDLGSAVLREATGISADGLVISGIGRREAGGAIEGWVIDLRPTGPSCPPCAADYDDNGGVDGGDLAVFFADFEQGAPCADVDENGGVDGGDIGTFFTAFEAGGC